MIKQNRDMEKLDMQISRAEFKAYAQVLWDEGTRHIQRKEGLASSASDAGTTKQPHAAGPLPHI